jgi:hypothetical protein
MRRAAPLLMSAVLLVGAAACGGGDDGLSERAQEWADAWAESLRDDTEGASYGRADAQCMAEAMMTELGTDLFDDAGVEPADIDPGADSKAPGELLGDGAITGAQADAILEAWDDCTDLDAALAEGIASSTDLDDEGVQCIEDGLRDSTLTHDGYRATFTSADAEPPQEVVAGLTALLSDCGADLGGGTDGGDGGTDGGGTSGLLVDSIAASLAEGGTLDDDQAHCLAQEIVDTIGFDRLMELGLEGGNFEDADPAVQQEMAAAVLDAATACDVPLSDLGG